MYVLTLARQLLLSIPLAIIWMTLYGLLIAGWGLETADKFIQHWNAFVQEGKFVIGETE